MSWDKTYKSRQCVRFILVLDNHLSRSFDNYMIPNCNVHSVFQGNIANSNFRRNYISPTNVFRCQFVNRLTTALSVCSIRWYGWTIGRVDCTCCRDQIVVISGKSLTNINLELSDTSINISMNKSFFSYHRRRFHIQLHFVNVCHRRSSFAKCNFLSSQNW